MNTRLPRTALALLCCTLLLAGCGKHTITYTQWTPIYMPLGEFRASVKSTPATDLKKTGKIYVKDNYLFVNEPDKGIHVIDNSDPRQPRNISFINIPGNGDLAVRDNILYADSYIDLVALDISDPANPVLKKRVESIFPNSLNQHGIVLDTTKGIAIDWKQETVTEEVSDGITGPVRGGVDMSGPTSSGEGTSNGIGGSMARFTIYQNYLYAVSMSDMQIFWIGTPANPNPWAKMNLGWNIETIFPYKDKLFIGSQTGMFIFDNASPGNPVQLCQFTHARSCDPVVTNGDYAYVTLRSGTSCGGFSNQLDVLDIRDIQKPVLIKSYVMQEPYGVGVDGSTIFVCDGVAGLKVFDGRNPASLQLLSFMPDFKTYDIIPLNGHAIVVGPDGLYQYDYTDPANLKLLSKIGIVP